ncbi:unnamed protein product [Cyprideis torosa]|uniref:Uncharacterized protein n=1 Tax=Cyprideis torosa TaxID=163714 RepID=A0A7R8W754_9CRUS|nr:unnamed protein product [Cyprideis torosa]CAG0881863.1 unnamed protein product [Cyprideis torosa]
MIRTAFENFSDHLRLNVIPNLKEKYGMATSSEDAFEMEARQRRVAEGLSSAYVTGFLISFGIRCNIGVAIVEMTEVESIPFGNETTIRHPLIDWSKDTIGIIESSFFWGYLITQVPGGFLASMYPASWLFGIAIFSSSCLNMLVPTAARLHPFLAVVVRVAQGIVEVGQIRIMDKDPERFRQLGLCGMVWYFFWYWLAFEKPSCHPTITEEEYQYIQIGALSALPHLLMTLIVPIGGRLADYLRENRILSTTNVRKIFMTPPKPDLR